MKILIIRIFIIEAFNAIFCSGFLLFNQDQHLFSVCFGEKYFKMLLQQFM